MPTTFRYLARLYRQTGPSSLPIVTFVARAGDIARWAGVPRKAEELGKGTYTGFQRALDEERAEDIEDFFTEPKNLSPTAIVVAFREETCTITPVDESVASTLRSPNEPGELVWVSFQLDDFESKSMEQLLQQFLASATRRVANESGNGSSTDAESQSESEEVTDASEFEVHDSHLRAFVNWLERGLAASRAGLPMPDGVTEEQLRGTLESMLTPAMLVDGQHRVYGGLRQEESLPFTVCALINAPWEEQVFQFVVINQQAEGIQGSFLSAIVSSSLTQAEVQDLDHRLESAGVNVQAAEMMDRINSDAGSPFHGMVKFGVVGERGWLPYVGMRQLALSWWRISGSDFSRVVEPACSGGTRRERMEDWKRRQWWNYFSSFWGVVRARYEPTPTGEIALWRDKESQLLRVVTLQAMQRLFLYWMKFSQREFNSNLDSFKNDVKSWAESFPPAFFRETWNGATLPKDREKLEDALKNLVANPEFKFRNSRLFVDRSGS